MTIVYDLVPLSGQCSHRHCTKISTLAVVARVDRDSVFTREVCDEHAAIIREGLAGARLREVPKWTDDL